GKIHTHPDIETIAKLIYTHKDIKKNLYFNYETKVSKWICTEEMKKNFNLEVVVGNGSTPLNIAVD
ncbi:hypothetical protein CD106_12785, partial [Staphylococcus xylosus]